MPFDFWRWQTEEDKNKQQARDLIEDSRKMQEDADRAEIQQHVGGIIENFQADVQRRMEPLTSRFNSYSSQPAAPAQPDPAPAAQPDHSLVDDVMSSFGNGAKKVADTVGAASDSLRETIRPVVDPVLDLVGTNEAMDRRERSSKIQDIATSQGHVLGAGSPTFARSEPELAREHNELESANVAGSVIGAGGGVVNTASKAAPRVASAVAGAFSGGNPFIGPPTAATAAARAASTIFNQAAARVSKSPAPPIAAGAAERVIDRSMDAATPIVELGLKDATYKFFDNLSPVQKLMEAREKVLGRALKDNENAYEILRLGRASREIASQWIEDHVGETLRALPNISGSVDQGTADMNRYLRAKDAIDKAAAKGNPNRSFGGMTAADAQQGLVEIEGRLGPQKFAELEAGANKFYELGDMLLERKVKAGLIDAATADHLRQLYPHHMPIQTIDWLDDKLASTSTRVGKAGGAANDIKELTEFGTDRKAVNPIEAFHRAADRTAALAAKNEAGSAIIAAARDVPRADALIRPADNVSANLSGLPTGPAASYARLPGETMVQYRINGNIVKFHVDKSLEPLFDYSVSVGDGPWKPILDKMAMPANLQRRVAIGYNPSWGVYQLAMDSFGAFVKNGGLANPKGIAQHYKHLGVAADEVGLNPFASRAVGAAQGAVVGGLAPDVDGDTTWSDRARNAAIGAGVGAALKSTGIGRRSNSGAIMAEARAAGALPGAVDHVSGAPGSYDRIIRSRTGVDVNGPADFIRKATDALLNGIQGVNEKLDAIPRLGEYQRVRALGDAEGTVQKAALAARDVTIDPSRGGEFTRAVNAVIPFYNVAFQSAAYAPRLLRNPQTRKRALSGIASSVVMPTLALEYYNQKDPRYKDVPDFDKDRGLVVMLPTKGAIDPNTGREKPPYLIQRTGPFTPFVVLSRALYNATPAGTGVDPTKTASALVRSASPIDFSPVVDAIGTGGDVGRAVANTALKYTPAAGKIITEAATNTDTFRDRPIVPEGLQNQPIENQYTQDTSDTAKALGAKLGMSPMLVDHLLKAWGGGSEALVGVVDNVGEAASAGIKATTGVDTGFGGSGDSQRLAKLRRDLAKTGLDPAESERIQGEIDREIAIKADRDKSLRNVPLIGGLGSRYYREGGSQSLDDRGKAVDAALLDKKRDKGPVGKELERLGVTFGDVKDEIGGIKLTRESGAKYREGALAYRERLITDLMKSDFYKKSDDDEKGRLVKDVMAQGAAWSAHEVAEGNPALAARLDEMGATGSAFIAPQIDKNVDVAARRYLGALKARQDVDELKANERFRNVDPKDYKETAGDISTLQTYKANLPDHEAEMVFQAKFGAERLSRALHAKESRFWQGRMDSFRRDNPDYGLWVESGPRVMTRRGLDATTVAHMAGL